jgi:hypothetical protein
VVADVVALIDRAPEAVCDGVNGLAHAVAQAVRVDLEELSLWCELQHVGAVELAGVGVGIVHIGAGADGDEHVGSVAGEDDVAGPVAATGELRPACERRDDCLRRAGGVQIAGVVGEALHVGGVGDIDELGIDGGVEGDAEGVVEAGGESGDLGGLAVGLDAAQDDDLAGAGVGEEEIAVGSGADEAGLGEGALAAGHVLDVVCALHGRGVAAGVERDLEARGRDGPRAFGPRDDMRLVGDGLVWLGLGQVGDGDLVAHTGGLLVPVGEGGLAGEKRLLGGGGDAGEGGEGEGDGEDSHGDSEGFLAAPAKYRDPSTSPHGGSAQDDGV